MTWGPFAWRYRVAKALLTAGRRIITFGSWVGGLSDRVLPICACLLLLAGCAPNNDKRIAEFKKCTDAGLAVGTNLNGQIICLPPAPPTFDFDASRRRIEALFAAMNADLEKASRLLEEAAQSVAEETQ